MEWVLLLTLEHLLGWLPMFVAGLIAFRAKGAWRWVGIVLALITILPLAAMWEDNRQFAFLQAMFMAVGGLGGALVGVLIQRRDTPTATPRWTNQGNR